MEILNLMEKKELEKISSSFKEMLIEADSRGGHATGFAMIDKHGDYLLCKKNQDAYRFLEDDQVDNNIDTNNDYYYYTY